MSNTTADYLSDLVTQRNALAENLTSLGVNASSSEKLDTLVPKVLQINTQPSLQSKSVTPSFASQTVSPDSGYYGLSSVTVSSVTSEIDENIAASNLKNGVTVLGVTGTYVGTNTSDTTATAADVLAGKQFYASDAALTQGTLQIPTLNAPTISVSNGTLTITDHNGSGFTDGWRLYNGDTLVSDVTATSNPQSVNVSNIAGVSSLTAVAYGEGFNDSAASNAASLTVYTITVNATGVSAGINNPATIISGGSVTLTFTAAEGYEMPTSVTATNALCTYDSGNVYISTPTGNVTVTVTGTRIVPTYSITFKKHSCGYTSNASNCLYAYLYKPNNVRSYLSAISSIMPVTYSGYVAYQLMTNGSVFVKNEATNATLVSHNGTSAVMTLTENITLLVGRDT